MQSQFYPINTQIDNIPDMKLGITTCTVEYTHHLQGNPKEPLCVFGNEQFANALLKWTMDMDEKLYLQTSIVKNSNQIALQFGLEVEVDPPQFSAWKNDVEVLLRIKAPKMKWIHSNEQTDTKKWQYRTFLNFGENGFNHNQQYQMQYLIEILSEMGEDNFVIQNTVCFFWKRGTRMMRSLFVVYSDQPLSSLLKHTIFRAFYGEVNSNKPLWTSQKFNGTRQSPKTLFLSELPKKPSVLFFNQVLAMMTANLLPIHLQLPDNTSGDIPF